MLVVEVMDVVVLANILLLPFSMRRRKGRAVVVSSIDQLKSSAILTHTVSTVKEYLPG
jgi:hypothetical protein